MKNKTTGTKLPKSLAGSWEIMAVLAITFVMYLPALQNNFLNWDDDTYIVENPDVKHTNFNSLKNIFTTSYNNTYVPISLLTWSLEYKIAGLSPWLYILNNIVLHVVNTLLVYLLLFRLFKRKDIAIITALFFGIHPLHVESVAWITERKDVLFTFFFLLSSLKYIRYAEAKNKQGRKQKVAKANLYYSLIFFLLSALSKGQAVALAPTLFIYDYVITGKLVDSKMLAVKIPYFIIALGIGITTLYFQDFFDGSHPEPYHFNLVEKFILSAKAFTAYIFLYFFPLKLAVIYPLPNPATAFPGAWYFYFTTIILFLALTVLAYFKKKKYLVFGLGFFLVNIFLLLDHSSVGKSLLADRFIYMASIGFSLILAAAIVLIPKYFRYGLILILILSMGYSTLSRAMIWNNEIILFTDAIDKYPQNPQAYNELGRKYFLMNDVGKAQEMLQKGLGIFPAYPEIINNMAVLLIEQEKYDEALTYLNKLPGQTENAAQLLNRSIIYFHLDRYDEALAEIQKAEQLSSKPTASFYTTKGKILENLDRNREALGLFNLAIELDSGYYRAYLAKATLLIKLQDYKRSEDNFQKAMALKPGDPQIMHGYASLKGQYQNDLQSSLIYLDKVIKADPNYYKAYLDKGIIYSMTNDPRNAIVNLDKCIALKSDYAPAYINRAMILLNLGRDEDAYNDFLFAKEHGGQIDEKFMQQLEEHLKEQDD